MQDEPVSVGIGEERHVANTRVLGLALELHSGPFQCGPRLYHIRHAQCDSRRVRRKPLALGLRLPEAERHVARVELIRAVLSKAQGHAVELLGPVNILRGYRNEVDALDFDQPTEPSIWSWIKRFISTAYSSGSSLVIGSTKPETIIAEASVSVSPRDMR